MSAIYYNYFLNQWKRGVIGEVTINNAVAKEYLTNDETVKLLATPQVTSTPLQEG